MSTTDFNSAVIDSIVDEISSGTSANTSKTKPKLEVEVADFKLEKGKVSYSSLFGKSFTTRDHNITIFKEEDWGVLKQYIPEVNPNYIFQPEACEKLAIAMEMGDYTMFTGPTGSGKSTLVEQYCALVKRPFIRINMTGDMETSAFFGQLTVADGATVWKDGLFTQGYRDGAVILIDEWELCPPEITMGLQRTLEDNGRLVLKEKPGGEQIKPHQDTRIIVGGNTLGQGDETGSFAGTNVQNTATIDRFNTVIKLDYLTKKHETDLIMKAHPDVTRPIAEKMVQFATLLRTGHQQGSVSLTCSPRTLLNWAKKTIYWGDPVTALKMAFFDKIVDSEKPFVNTLVNKVFSKQIK